MYRSLFLSLFKSHKKLITPRYSWNISKVGVESQSYNQHINIQALYEKDEIFQKKSWSSTPIKQSIKAHLYTFRPFTKRMKSFKRRVGVQHQSSNQLKHIYIHLDPLQKGWNLSKGDLAFNTNQAIN